MSLRSTELSFAVRVCATNFRSSNPKPFFCFCASSCLSAYVVRFLSAPLSPVPPVSSLLSFPCHYVSAVRLSAIRLSADFPVVHPLPSFALPSVVRSFFRPLHCSPLFSTPISPVHYAVVHFSAVRSCAFRHSARRPRSEPSSFLRPFCASVSWPSESTFLRRHFSTFHFFFLNFCSPFDCPSAHAVLGCAVRLSAIWFSIIHFPALLSPPVVLCHLFLRRPFLCCPLR